MALVKEEKPATFLLARAQRIEQQIADLNVNDRINILGYMICGYVCAIEPEQQARKNIVRGWARTMLTKMLPAYAPLYDAMELQAAKAATKQ